MRILLFSGKGGVGKTNIATNLAYHLSQMNKKTLILDADMGLANIDVILGIAPKYNLSHVLSGEKALADVILKGPGGMHILPASSGIQEMAELSKGEKLALLDELVHVLVLRVDVRSLEDTRQERRLPVLQRRQRTTGTRSSQPRRFRRRPPPCRNRRFVWR